MENKEDKVTDDTNIFKSRTFWTAVIGGVVTLALYFVAKYFAAGLEDLQTVLNVALPIVLILIAKYTIDDAVKIHTQGQIKVEELRLQRVQAEVRLAEVGAGARSGVRIEEQSANRS